MLKQSREVLTHESKDACGVAAFVTEHGGKRLVQLLQQSMLYLQAHVNMGCQCFANQCFTSLCNFGLDSFRDFWQIIFD